MQATIEVILNRIRCEKFLAVLTIILDLLVVCLFSHPLAHGQAITGARHRRPFEGFKALVVEPEAFWGWDAVVFGAPQERHFDVTYAKPEAPRTLHSYPNSI